MSAAHCRRLFAAALFLSVAGGGVRAADPAAGRQKAATCQSCHGIDGVGKLPDVPNIAGEPAEYLTRQLGQFKSGERQHEQMSIIAQSLSEADIDDLAAWYSSIVFNVTLPP